MALTPITILKGIKITGKPPETEILGIICIIPIIKKYKLATLENWTNKFLGIKFNVVYFDVFILLSHTYVSAILLIILLFGIF